MFKIMAYVLSIVAALAKLTIPMAYSTFEMELAGYPVTGYQLTLDMNNEDVSLSHGFSFDGFYGFEKTSEISKRHQATAAINGMFYSQYGMPYGMMFEDGQVLGINTIGGPLVYVDHQNRVHIEDVEVIVYAISDEVSVELDGVNASAPTGTIMLYDSLYGSTNRIYRDSVTYVLNEGIVTDIIFSDTAVQMALGDYLITHVTASDQPFFEIGDEISIQYEMYNVESGDPVLIDDGFQTGGWLVKNGLNIAKDYEPFIGYTTSLHPRTVVGVTEDNRLIFMVVDGRQEHSTGITGGQIADLMIEAGCISGGYLDGGASSTMVINDTVMNSPSGGEEREVAHSILIHYHPQ